jgi:hypothetical protein
LTVEQAQALVDLVLKRIDLHEGAVVSVKLVNGCSLIYPAAFLHFHGHQYEAKLIESFPELNSVSRGKGDAALKLGVLNVIEDFSGWLPIELVDTFLAMR